MGSLIAFEAACRHGNFSHAADELASTQSAVSRQIKQLEDYFGLQLFERRHRDVAVMDQARHFAEVVSATLNEIALASDRLKLTRTSRDILRLRIDSEHARSLLFPHFEELKRIFSDTQFDITVTPSTHDLAFDHFDICFHADLHLGEPFSQTPISDDWIFPVCSPEFAETLPAPCTGADLAKATLLHYRDPHRGWTTWQDFFDTFDIPAENAGLGPIFSQYSSCFDVAEHGAGIALAWYSQAKARLREGRLVRVTDLRLKLPNDFSVIMNNRHPPHPLTKQFIKFFRDRVDLTLDDDQYRAR